VSWTGEVEGVRNGSWGELRKEGGKVDGSWGWEMGAGKAKMEGRGERRRFEEGMEAGTLTGGDVGSCEGSLIARWAWRARVPGTWDI